jgi:uncharacterized membrane protein YphA (DoxX/SURF4 family)
MQFLASIKKLSIRSLIYWVLIGMLAILFMVSGISKIVQIRQFEDSIMTARIVPSFLVDYVSRFIIGLEIVVSIGLLFRKTREKSLELIFLLSSTFLAYSIWRMIQGISMPCHCFGILFRMSPVVSILLNAGIISSVIFCNRQNTSKI